MLVLMSLESKTEIKNGMTIPIFFHLLARIVIDTTKTCERF